MPPKAYLALGAVLLLLLACAPAGRAAPHERDPLAEAVLELVNTARAEARACGDVWFPAAGPLRLQPQLTAAARAHSEDMRRSGTLSHTGSDGSDIVDRAERQGYAWSRLAENVAYGYPDAASVVAGWLGSPGHCVNIMNADYAELGVGLAGTYWTQVFGTPR